MAETLAATLDTEQEFFSAGVSLIAGMDEVGRGSLAGPVAVGVALIPAHAKLEVEGLIDSKALTEKKRRAMVPLIHQWCITEVGYTQPAEIDALGMTASLRLAGQRALAKAVARSSCLPDMVLLDGKHDWLTPPEPDLLAELEPGAQLYQHLLNQAWHRTPDAAAIGWQGPVSTVIKGDYKCASIAAASVVAKVDRDELMNELANKYPDYGWVKNKGYGSTLHRQALLEKGPSSQHRLSWNLGVSADSIKEAYLQRAREGA